jgi:hypothetical protein
VAPSGNASIETRQDSQGDTLVRINGGSQDVLFVDIEGHIPGDLQQSNLPVTRNEGERASSKGRQDHPPLRTRSAIVWRIADPTKRSNIEDELEYLNAQATGSYATHLPAFPSAYHKQGSTLDSPSPLPC